ncbi:MAG: extracellular solute-binding protein [Spirochaetia bacterium]|nr:extracellular solute-binding protein [Spirochaetia bacterium]
MKKFSIVCVMVFASFGYLFAQGSNEQVSNAKPYEGKTLTVSMWGYNMDILEKNIIKPFEEEFGCKIVVETGNNSDRLTKMVARKANPVVDVALFAGSFTYKAKEEGVIKPYNPAVLTNLDKIMDQAKDPIGDSYGIGYSLSNLGLFYRSDKCDEITSWKDLLDPKYAGTVTIPTITTTYGPAFIYMLTKAYTGDFKDTEIGWQKLEELAPNLVTAYSKSSELNTLISQEEVYIAPFSSFSWGSIEASGLDVAKANPVEGLPGTFSVASVGAGTKNETLANEFINWLISYDVQLSEALDQVDSPVRTDVVVPDEIAVNLAYGDELISNLYFFDEAEIAANQEQWIARWNEIFSK